jgi:hypothetical protein
MIKEDIMACFLVSAAEAVVVTAAAKVIEKKEHAPEETETVRNGEGAEEHVKHTPFSRKLKWLSSMLWGGSALLAFEHLWHGEVVPFPPFLTAASDPADTAVMLHEMSTVGVCMAALITAVWVGMVIVSNVIENRAEKEAPVASQEV